MFDRRLAVPEITQIIDELVAASYFDEFTLGELQDLYRKLQRGLRVSVVAAHPGAPADQVDVVVHGLLALGHAGATFGWLGFDRAHYRKLRAAADVLVATLEPTPTTRHQEPEEAACCCSSPIASAVTGTCPAPPPTR